MVLLPRLFLTLALLPLVGCALHDQVQYFEVVDPESGNINYYRLTVRGHGGLGSDYHLQAGYFSAASVDVLRGRMPDMPEVDLPLEQNAAFDQLVDRYYTTLLEAAERPATQREPSSTADLDGAVLRQARLVWLGQLAPADVAAMGMNQTADPFQFRKLVFWTASKNVDLRAFGSEIDALLANATSLVRAQQTQSRQRLARRAGLQRFLDQLLQNSNLAAYPGLVEALCGAAPSKTNPPSEKTNEPSTCSNP